MTKNKLNASLILKNAHDKHLNVFWQYDGKPWLENNITKALINTFDSLDDSDKKTFFKELFGIELAKDRDYTFKYHLQKDPEKNKVEKNKVKEFNKKNIRLFAFSPTGKAWGADGTASGDKDKMRESVEKKILKEYPNIAEKKLENKVEAELKRLLDNIEERNTHDSIPDAWIFVYYKGKAEYLVAFENKLWDLDPNQLNNHCKTSLLLDEDFLRKNKDVIIYSDFQNILNTLNGMNSYLTGEFIRYMYYLNKWNVDSVAQLEGMDDESIRLHSELCCYNLLKKLSRGKEVSKHKTWMLSFDTEQKIPFIQEIGLHYNAEKKAFEAVLAVATTQGDGIKYYEEFYNKETIENNTDDSFTYGISFHLNRGNLGNISDSYYSEKVDKTGLLKYTEFVKTHLAEIKGSAKGKKKTEKIIVFTEKMLAEGFISAQFRETLISIAKNYENSVVGIVPEFLVYIEIPFEEAVALDKDGDNKLADAFREKIRKAYKAFSITEEPWMK